MTGLAGNAWQTAVTACMIVASPASLAVEMVQDQIEIAARLGDAVFHRGETDCDDFRAQVVEHRRQAFLGQAVEIDQADGEGAKFASAEFGRLGAGG